MEKNQEKIDQQIEKNEKVYSNYEEQLNQEIMLLKKEDNEITKLIENIRLQRIKRENLKQKLLQLQKKEENKLEEIEKEINLLEQDNAKKKNKNINCEESLEKIKMENDKMEGDFNMKLSQIKQQRKEDELNHEKNLMKE